jgi:hypothetical protein
MDDYASIRIEQVGALNDWMLAFASMTALIKNCVF